MLQIFRYRCMVLVLHLMEGESSLRVGCVTSSESPSPPVEFRKRYDKFGSMPTGGSLGALKVLMVTVPAGGKGGAAGASV